jgi:predicted metal-binding membrane protein
MWIVMMSAMMLPSLTPMLWRYRQSIASAPSPLRGRLTALVGLGYFFVWTLFGLVVFPMGFAAATIEMQHPTVARTVPFTTGLIVLIAGALQFTKWKTRHLAFCREAPGPHCVLPTHPGAAWRQGLHFGLHCGLSCANLTAILLVVGIMDLRAMVAVTAAITAERIAPAGEHVPRAIGAVLCSAGFFMIARTTGIG